MVQPKNFGLSRAASSSYLPSAELNGKTMKTKTKKKKKKNGVSAFKINMIVTFV